MAKNTATESPCAQGTPESSNPSGLDLKPPSRLEQADTWDSQPFNTPVPGRLFLINVIKSVTFCSRLPAFFPVSLSGMLFTF